LITWQWAPDRRPARQAGQLLSLTRLGSTFLLGCRHLSANESGATCAPVRCV